VPVPMSPERLGEGEISAYHVRRSWWSWLDLKHQEDFTWLTSLWCLVGSKMMDFRSW
jgi:hypothetical protein